MRKNGRNILYGSAYSLRGICLSIMFVVLLCLPAQALSFGEDLEQEFFKGARSMEDEYAKFEREAFAQFKRDVEAMWGDFVVSTKKDWVEYSDDRTGRSRVDFETGVVVVEVIVPKAETLSEPTVAEEKLAEEIERLVVDHGKNRDYEVPLPPEPVAIGKPEEKKVNAPEPLLPSPVLEGQLENTAGEPVTEDNKKEFAQEVIHTQPVKTETLSTEKGDVVKATVQFTLVPDHLRVRAEQYLAPVKDNTGRHDLAVPLAFAVIHTESYFNPKATSPAPAYGLMQLVPTSGGRDAYRYVYGKDRVVTAEYLYVPENNIELGCAYLGFLKDIVFRNVQDPQNTIYCIVASYNTGPGNVSRAVCGNKHVASAVERINTMTPDELYEHLRTNLPYQETRDYLKKVRDRSSLYQEWQ